MTNTIIPVSENKQIRWTALFVDDLNKVISVNYQFETITPTGIIVESATSYQTIGQHYEDWDSQLGVVIRAAITNGIKTHAGIQ